MKEKLQRFITAFKMNGEVKKKTMIALIAVVAVIAIIILVICLKPASSPDVPDEPIDQGPVEPDYSDRVEPDPIVEPDTMAETFEKYPDVFAWLHIPGTKEGLEIESDTSYPVALAPAQQAGADADSTRNYYLYRDLDGNYYKPGTLFAESMVEGKYINGRDLSDPVTVIYGHNMANRSMFGGLERFIREMDFSQEHVMYMYQDGRRLTYEIVGGVQYDTSHVIYYHDFYNDQVFDDFFTALWKETAGSTNLNGAEKPEAGDKVLILSVCKNGDTEHKHRYLIVGKLIEDTADPSTWAIAETADTTATE